MPLAYAILADNMRFSHYLMSSDSTPTQSAALASMTQLDSKLRGIKPPNLEQMRNYSFSIRYDFYLLGRTNKILQSLDVLMKWQTPKLWVSLPALLIVPESQKRRFSHMLNFSVCNRTAIEHSLLWRDIHWSAICSENLMWDFLHPPQLHSCQRRPSP